MTLWLRRHNRCHTASASCRPFFAFWPCCSQPCARTVCEHPAPMPPSPARLTCIDVAVALHPHLVACQSAAQTHPRARLKPRAPPPSLEPHAALVRAARHEPHATSRTPRAARHEPHATSRAAQAVTQAVAQAVTSLSVSGSAGASLGVRAALVEAAGFLLKTFARAE